MECGRPRRCTATAAALHCISTRVQGDCMAARKSRSVKRTARPARAGRRKASVRKKASGQRSAAVRRKSAVTMRRERRRRERETLRLREFQPTFTVNDIERSVRFYTEVLGFIVIEQMSDGAQLQGVL